MALRTVGVRLEADTSTYQKNIGAAGEATEDLVRDLQDQDKASKQAGKSADGLASAARRLAADARKLDGDIARATHSVRDLARDIAKTDDAAGRLKLSEKLKVEQKTIRDLEKVRKLMQFPDLDPNFGLKTGVKFGSQFATGAAEGLAKAGGAISGALSNVFGTLPPQAQLAIGTGVVAALAAAAPLIGGVIASAVIGAAGAGGLVGGFTIAARHPAVKQAALGLKTTFLDVLETAAASFVPVTQSILSMMESELKLLEKDFEEIFSGAAKLAKPLARDLIEAFKAMLPGLKKAIQNAGPVFEALGDGVIMVGQAIGQLFAVLAEHSVAAGEALRTIFAIISGGIKLLGGFLALLSEAFLAQQKLSAILRGDFMELTRLAAQEEVNKKRADDLSISIEDLVKNYGDYGTKAADAAAETKKLNTAFNELFGIAMSLDQATIAYEASVDDLVKTLAKGRKTLDDNTEAGRENQTEILNHISSIESLRNARVNDGMAIDEANVKYIEELNALRATAIQMGFNATQIDNLIGKYFQIPRNVSTRVSANTAPALSAAQAIVRRINNMRARIRVEAEPSGGYGGSAGTGEGYSTGYRWGGVVEHDGRVHAQEGALRDAQVFSTTAPARYAFAEPATGGEAFIPKNGDTDRSMSILNRAASWYGAQVMPAGMSMGGRNDRVTVLIEGTGVLKGLRKEIRIQGGVVQQVLGG